MNLFTSIAPADLGLPAKFACFRPNQSEAMEYALYEADQAKRFTVLGLPTGAGKSLTAMAIASQLASKSVYLTASKGLEDQVLAEFADMGLVDVRGRSNYKCSKLSHLGNSKGNSKWQMSCEQGYKHDCSLRMTDGCPSYSAILSAQQSQYVVTNYALWLNSRKWSETALCTESDQAGLLICDEVHSAFDQIASFMSVTIYVDSTLSESVNGGNGNGNGNGNGDSGLMPTARWTDWAKQSITDNRKLQVDIAARYFPASAARDEQYQECTEAIERAAAIARMDGNWVWEQADDNGKIVFTPIWIAPYTESLWSGVARILLISATVRPYTLALLGIRKDAYEFREWPAVFQPALGPVYHIPTARMTWRATEDDYKTLIARMDEIIDSRQDRKGIVHTVSYSRMQKALEMSRHSGKMIVNQPGSNIQEALGRFRQSSPGTVLVSPSVGTGYDFPGQAAEYQIILKVPFPNESNRVEKERCKSPDYRLYKAVQDTVQMCGRARRYADDRAETFILDNNIGYALGAGKKFAPASFKVWTVKVIPPRPPKL